MKIVNTVAEVREQVKEWRKQGLTVGLVPTMGYLHEGHKSLIDRAVADNDRVVVSVFVNPMQFGPSEDLESYPRDMDRDAALCEDAGASLIFHPEPSEMYHDDFSSFVDMSTLTGGLCGKTRPIHFRGVWTVVSKLFNIVTPDRAYFGQKDAQQLAVIRHMVSDLNVGIEIVGCPIIREEDGLAKSSRNTYLSPEERKAALVLSRSLKLGKKLIDYMVAICCPAMVGLFCLSKPIVEEFAGASYSEAYLPLQLLSIALVFAVFANFFANCVLISYKKEKIVMFATILSAVVNIVLNFILIPGYQESAAAFTTIVAEVCVCVISAYESRKIIKINCTARNLISTIIGCVGIVICCMLAAKVIENQIYLILVSVIVSGLVYAVVLILMKNTVITDVLERFVRGARG